MYGQPRAVTHDGVTYTPGAKYRVLRPCALDGMALVPDVHYTAHQGWRQELQPGDIVTCTGHHAGWGSDPGYGVHFVTDESKAAHASYCEILPNAGGMWNYHPAPGLLELAEA